MSVFSGVGMLSAFTGGIFGGMVAPEEPRRDAETTEKVVICRASIGLGGGGGATVEMCRRSKEDRAALKRHDREHKQTIRENKEITRRETIAGDATVSEHLREIHHGRARAAEDRNKQIERDREDIKKWGAPPKSPFDRR